VKTRSVAVAVPPIVTVVASANAETTKSTVKSAVDVHVMAPPFKVESSPMTTKPAVAAVVCTVLASCTGMNANIPAIMTTPRSKVGIAILFIVFCIKVVI
jgi:hypothetical protein